MTTIQASLIGYPRIGPNRELKWALERAWSGRMEPSAFDERVAELRRAHLAEQRGAIGSAIDDFFLYDEVLETALMLGIVPGGVGDVEADPFGVLTALARGTPEREAWEMTKWFDTNYHYVVPEIDGAIQPLRPLPWREPGSDEGVTWPILGPYSLVKLSKLAPGLDPVATALAAGDAIWNWVAERSGTDPAFRIQLDEPCLGMVMSDADVALRDAAYATVHPSGTPIVTVQFGRASDETLESLGRKGLAVQIPVARVAELRGTAAWDAQPEHVVAVMEGRTPWPDDFERGANGPLGR